MSKRSRILAFGSAAMLAVLGGCCAVIVPGTTGQALAFVLIALGLSGIVLLVFLEVGLSEDRERAREQKRRRKAASRLLDARESRRSYRPRWPRRPS